MDFFPEPPDLDLDLEDDDPPQPVWMGPPEDVLPGVVPVELLLGRSASTALTLTGIRAFPTGLAMTLGVRMRGSSRRRDLHSEVFDGPYEHDMGREWQAQRLKWGFELADGRRVTNVDPWQEPPEHSHAPGAPDDWRSWTPERPVLHGGGGSGGSRSVDREQWLWPLPPAGPLTVVCQWLEHDIELTVHRLDAEPFLAAAARARPLWPDEASPA